MCGIAGIVNISDRHEAPTLSLLQSMIGALKHRGPDGFGVYRDMRAGLAHARLSIIDLNTGDQPMTNEDGTLWIIFNGEIFNYVELRADLERRGHLFKSKSDTEVILHAFESWGTDCFERFNGQWALALWNNKTNTLVLSRDRIGVRPLHIHENNGRVWFASEVKAIFADPSVPRQIDPCGLDQTFTYWSSIAPATMFKGIEELPPATFRMYDAYGKGREKIYWTPPFSDSGSNGSLNHPSIKEASEQLREKLTVATKLRMLRSDVPVGSYLSGGLDSSIIAWLGRQAVSGNFHTFSLRFEDAEYDETSFQRMMTSILDSSHSEMLVRKQDIADVFPDVIWHTERPLMRTASAPMYLLSRTVQQSGIKAVLTGEGADEMLAGYDIFREAKIREFWSRDPQSRIRPLLFDRVYPYLARSPGQAKGLALEFWKRGLERAGKPGFSHDLRWWTSSSLKKFFSKNTLEHIQKKPSSDVLLTLPQEFSRWDSLAQAQYLEITTLLSSYLISSQGDRMLMAHSVEGRFPFLDADVMDFCCRLPSHHKLAILDEKHVLKKMANGMIPAEIIKRKKQPYRAPDAVCFIHKQAPEYVSELLSERALAESGLFDIAKARGLYAKCVKLGSEPERTPNLSNADNMALVAILSTQILHNSFILGKRPSDKTEVVFKTSSHHKPTHDQQSYP